MEKKRTMDQPVAGRGGGVRGRGGQQQRRRRGGRGGGRGGGGANSNGEQDLNSSGGRGGGGRGGNRNRNRKRFKRQDSAVSSDVAHTNKRIELSPDTDLEMAMDGVVLSPSANEKPDAPVIGAVSHQGATKDPSFMTKQTFASLRSDAVHHDTSRAVTDIMKLSCLTEIQLKTLVAIGSLPLSAGGGEAGGQAVGNRSSSSGVDVLGRARTGTGKTVAFLVPAIQTVIEKKPTSPVPSVRVLVISPTRELATQISVQAEALLTFHKRTLGLHHQVVYGGTNIKSDVSKFNSVLPTILVATPGRLKDHLENTKLSSGRAFSEHMRGLQVLVLDEADQLLEMGFRPDIRAIISYLPPIKDRQTLLFSATMPKELRSVMAESMKPDYVTVDCIHDKAPETNVHVAQSHIILPSMDRIVIGVVEVVLEAMRRNPDNHKIIAFFSTARQTGYFSDVFNSGMNIPVIEIHSRKSQSHRDKASDKFRKSKRAVLFSSDVSARGVDYPDVTHVIQFGLPDNREQYIHRLGRTGRAGRAGKGWLVLAPFESGFLRELKSVDCPKDEDLRQLLASPPRQDVLDAFLPVLDRIRDGDQILTVSAERCYQAWLGFYNSNLKRIGKMSKTELVRIANEFSILSGLPRPPPLEKRTVGKMGLKGVPGLNFK